MKFIIVGLHASGKQEVLDALEQKGVSCGRLFSNIEEADSTIYNSYNYELYSTSEVRNIFENNAYIFLHALESSASINAYKYYEGLSFYEFDSNDVFALSPNQVVDIPQNINKNDICYVWLDNTKANRITRFNEERRMYNFNEQDNIETRDTDVFVKEIYNHPVLYFSNEDPQRVATIIYACIQHPSLLDEFIASFS